MVLLLASIELTRDFHFHSQLKNKPNVQVQYVKRSLFLRGPENKHTNCTERIVCLTDDSEKGSLNHTVRLLDENRLETTCVESEGVWMKAQNLTRGKQI